MAINWNNTPSATSQSSGGINWNDKQPAPVAPLVQQAQPSLSDQIWHGIAGAGSQIAGAFSGGIDQVKQGYQDSKVATNPIQKTEAGLGMLAGGVNAAFSPTAPLTAPIGSAINAVSDKVSDLPAVQNFAQSNAGKTTSRVAQDVQNTAAVLPVAAGILSPKEVGSNVNSTVKSVSDTANTLKGIQYVSDTLPKQEPATLPVDEAKVTDMYNRAIKPSSAGKTTAGKIAKADSQVVTGLKTIADNKPNLTFTGQDGETITGATPKTVSQLSDAIAQTKTSIFHQYDALAKQAGEAGVTVDTSKIVSELQPVIDSKSLQLANPSAVKYAQETQQRYLDSGPLSAADAQDVIQHYNESLKAFYRNPSAETASKAGIDAMLANKLREQLDAGISGATGAQYQALKSQYGALASMEKDVARKNLALARQSGTGFSGNLANIASGAELAHGLFTMNPATMGTGLVIKAIQKYHQYLNNPDVGVSKMFSELNKK